MLKRISQYCYGLFTRVTPVPQPVPMVPKAYVTLETITTIGTVVFHKKQRFYGILTDGGSKYLPFNLHEFPACVHNGLRVHFTARLHPEVLDIHNWGTTVRLLTLNRAP